MLHPRLRLATSIALVCAMLGACRGGGVAKVAEDVHVEGFVAGAHSEEEYRAIWGTPPTVGQLRRVDVLTSKASSNGIRLLGVSGAASAASTFQDSYASSTADVVSIVGHNDLGAFKFSGGSDVLLSNLGGSSQPILAVFSCDSDRYVNGSAVGVTSPISIQVALLAQERFLQLVRALPSPPNAKAAQDLVNSAVDSAARQLQVRVVYRTGLGLAGAGVVGGSIYVVRPS